jgi:hypothetical protein
MVRSTAAIVSAMPATFHLDRRSWSQTAPTMAMITGRPDDGDQEEEAVRTRVSHADRGRSGHQIGRDGSALPGWGRQGRAPDWAPYFFFAFFLVAFFFIMSPPSRSPRVPRWLIVSDNMVRATIVSRRKYTMEGKGGSGGPISWGPASGRSAGIDRGYPCSWAEEGLRCSLRLTNSWLSGIPFLQNGQVSGG